LGRNPGSTALRAALAVAGHAISDRDSRWLVKQMPLWYEGEPRPVWPGLNPGSTALGLALSVAGHAIRDRDSRWLAKQLPLSGMRYQ